MSEIIDANINDIISELKHRKRRANIKLVQKAYDYIIKTNHPIVANYIKSLDLMELE